MTAATAAPGVVEGTADDITEAAEASIERPAATAPTSQELAARQATGHLTVTPQAEAKELVARLDVIRDAMNNAMVENVDYGVIPGTNKPTLLKPGAEKLGVLFQLDVQIDNIQVRGPGNHLTVTSKATVFHIPTGARIGYGEGLCTTLERKYAKRKQERTCPTCGAAAVIKGKAEYGGGWLCWKKRHGCNAKFPDGDQAIEGQEVGEIENPDLPDLWNTAIKMGEKRARVDAVLAVTGASALFTQDAEDRATTADEPGPAAPASPEVASDELRTTAANALAFVLGVKPGHQAVGRTLGELSTDQGLPKLSALAIGKVATTLKKAQEARAGAAPAAPAQEPLAPDDDPPPPELATGQPAMDLGDRPAPGSIKAPDLSGSPVADIKALKAVGCVCESPLEAQSDIKQADDACPVHGIGF